MNGDSFLVEVTPKLYHIMQHVEQATFPLHKLREIRYD